jgi:signal transduction histidine kinase
MTLGVWQIYNEQSPLRAQKDTPMATLRTRTAADQVGQLLQIDWWQRHMPRLAQGIWLLLAILLMTINIIAIPQTLELLSKTCPREPCFPGMVPHSLRWMPEMIGLSLPMYAILHFALRVIAVVSHTLIGAILIFRRPDQLIARLGAFMLLVDGTVMGGLIGSYDYAAPQIWLFIGIFLLCNALVTNFFYRFPHQAFAAPWLRWLTWFWVLSFAALAITPLWWPHPLLATVSTIHLSLWLLSLVIAQIARFATAPSSVERQQSKWILLGVALGYGAFMLLTSAQVLVQTADLFVPFLAPFVVKNLMLLLSSLVPIAFAMAILRARLYDIDIIISRTLVYSTLTLAIALSYVLIVSGLSQFVQHQFSPIISFLAVGIIATIVQPLRNLFQRAANQLVYGHRDEPYQVLAKLGERLGAALSPQEVLPTVAASVREALKLPYVAVTLHSPTGEVVASESGVPTPALLRLPLVFQHEAIGQLVVGQRTPDQPFTRNEQQLLADLARQASIAVHAVRLNHDLQRSRERLVATREEERQRIQRDLHDELGPTLASMTMQLDAARVLLTHDPSSGEQLVAEVQSQLREAVVNVRRIVHQLRPPLLDQVGLMAAIREHIGRCERSGILRIRLEAPAQLPMLGAAIEVVAYYIVGEALTNIVRHAHAQHCRIHVAVDQGLQLIIEDDGIGLAANHPSGVGLHSMRTRAAEVGGWCLAQAQPNGGTQIAAWLPLSNDLQTQQGVPG